MIREPSAFDQGDIVNRSSGPWLALAALLASGAVLFWFLDPGAWNWQPERAWSQPWRWWTAAWVHLSPLHLGANLAGAGLVAALGHLSPVNRTDAFAWLAAWPLTHLALLAQPSLVQYGGLSGVLHAGVVVAALSLALRERGARRTIGAALLAGVALKLLLEEPWQGALRHSAGWDIAIAPAAHVSGACAGVVCALLARCTALASR